MYETEIRLSHVELMFSRRLAKEYFEQLPLYVICTHLRAANASPIHPRYSKGENKWTCCLRLAHHDVATAWKKLPMRKLASVG